MQTDERTALAAAGWQFLCERAGILVLRVNREGVILQANRHAVELTGMPLVGGPLEKIFLGFADGPVGRRLLDEPGKIHLANIRTATGLPETLYFTVVPVGDETVLFGQTDASEQARLRKEVLVLNHELGNLSRELTQKNAELAWLNEQKTQFLGMATHDLRKPAGLILSYAEMLAEEASESLQEDQLQLLDTIRASAERMKRVIDDFLDVAMIESGKLNLDLGAVDIEELVRSPLLLVSKSASRRGVVITTDLAPAGQRLRVDGQKIEQVITNLLSNAVEHSPDGATVRVGSRRDGEGMRFSVTDEGKGFSEEERARLFTAFAGAGGRKKDGERSIGLGLAISRRIVEAHGGRMMAESATGKGATVAFTLPARCLVPAQMDGPQGGEVMS